MALRSRVQSPIYKGPASPDRSPLGVLRRAGVGFRRGRVPLVRERIRLHPVAGTAVEIADVMAGLEDEGYFAPD